MSWFDRVTSQLFGSITRFDMVFSEMPKYPIRYLPMPFDIVFLKYATLTQF